MGKVIFAAVMLLLSACATQKRAEISAETALRVKEQLNARDYTIEVRMAYPAGWRSLPLTFDYSLTIKVDSINSHLPYFGRAYSLPYGGGEGLVFNSVIQNYQTDQGKRDRTVITFQTSTAEDEYSFQIILFPSGSSTLHIQPNNKQMIGFSGEMVMKEP